MNIWRLKRNEKGHDLGHDELNVDERGLPLQSIESPDPNSHFRDGSNPHLKFPPPRPVPYFPGLSPDLILELLESVRDDVTRIKHPDKNYRRIGGHAPVKGGKDWTWMS